LSSDRCASLLRMDRSRFTLVLRSNSAA